MNYESETQAVASGVFSLLRMVAESNQGVRHIANDTPLPLHTVLGLDVLARSGLRIVGVDGLRLESEIDLSEGVRIGSGDGVGCLYNDPKSGALMFVSDAAFEGLCTFACTIADESGVEASVLTTVHVVKPAPMEIVFADGAHCKSVFSGAMTSIVGTLSIPDLPPEDVPPMLVYEGPSDTPSSRFSVSGDRLHVCGQLSEKPGDTLRLRVVAVLGDDEVATGQFVLDLRSPEQAGEVPTAAHLGARLTLVSAADRVPNAIQGASAREDLEPQPEALQALTEALGALMRLSGSSAPEDADTSADLQALEDVPDEQPRDNEMQFNSDGSEIAAPSPFASEFQEL